jgi:tetratricopeptide (TPR) repeat protein
MKLMALGIIAALPVVLCGCLNPITAGTADRYYAWGMEAEKSGDLKSARKFYSRAFWNAQAAYTGSSASAHRAKAYTLYELSRVTGYLGDHGQAEQGFSNVLVLIEKAAPKADRLRAPALCEYARLLHDTSQHERALPFFERAITEAELRKAHEFDPIGMADFLDDYAASLRASSHKADAITAKARALREANKGGVAKQTPPRYVTPQ